MNEFSSLLSRYRFPVSDFSSHKSFSSSKDGIVDPPGFTQHPQSSRHGGHLSAIGHLVSPSSSTSSNAGTSTPSSSSAGGFMTIGASGSATPAVSDARQTELVKRKLSAIGNAPFQQLFMVGLMLYMSGSGLHLMALMMLFMATKQCLTPLLQINKAFRPYADSGVPLLQYKLRFVVGYALGLAMVIYKLQKMGLLKTGPPHYDPIPMSTAGFSASVYP